MVKVPLEVQVGKVALIVKEVIPEPLMEVMPYKEETQMKSLEGEVVVATSVVVLVLVQVQGEKVVEVLAMIVQELEHSKQEIM